MEERSRTATRPVFVLILGLGLHEVSLIHQATVLKYMIRMWCSVGCVGSEFWVIAQMLLLKMLIHGIYSIVKLCI